MALRRQEDAQARAGQSSNYKGFETLKPIRQRAFSRLSMIASSHNRRSSRSSSLRTAASVLPLRQQRRVHRGGTWRPVALYPRYLRGWRQGDLFREAAEVGRRRDESAS
eukprot:6206079-Pleurochrysis_carterae.AAC.1